MLATSPLYLARSKTSALKVTAVIAARLSHCTRHSVPDLQLFAIPDNEFGGDYVRAVINR